MDVLARYEKKVGPKKKTPKGMWGSMGNSQPVDHSKNMFEKKLPDVKVEVRDAILKMYLQACNYRHSLAFF